MKAIMQARYGGYTQKSWEVNKSKGVTTKVLLIGVDDERTEHKDFKVSGKIDFSKLKDYQIYNWVINVPTSSYIRDGQVQMSDVTIIDIVPFDVKEK